ncbi:glutaredoxin family protein [Lysobacter enzymogenes]|uniref:Glutaredoxin family protein n=1 Tax=Lysobacter enzymogenes TaxID=69 RepID=A0A3N2RHD2_LYSEN|nr:glutaredoxin family protein [Lysobacter enzymogenes]ROU06799.1 glutaredoxin family protein [Lysobacter enzymogenes]
MNFKSILTTILVVALALGLGVGAGYLVRNTGLLGGGGKGVEIVQGDYSAVYAKAGGDIVLYSLSTCPFCHKAKELLDKRNVRYVERVIDKDEAARKEADGLKINSVPVIYIGDQSMRGYDEAKLAELLDKHGKKA